MGDIGLPRKQENANLHTVTFNVMLQGKGNETARAFVRDEARALTRARV